MSSKHIICPVAQESFELLLVFILLRFMFNENIMFLFFHFLAYIFAQKILCPDLVKTAIILTFAI